MKKFLAMGVLISTVWAGICLYAGMRHNMQGEFILDGNLDVAYSSLVFLSWFFAILIPWSAATVGLFWLFTLRRSDQGKPSDQ